MNSKQDQAVQLLRLPDSDYFSFDDARQVKLQQSLASLAHDGDLPGAPLPEPILALGSPATIALDQRSSVPLLIGHVQTGLRNWQVNFESNLHLFVRNQSTGRLLFAEPLINMRRPRQPLLSGVGKPPDATAAGSVYSGVSLVDLRGKIGEAVTPGRLTVTAVVNELRSNSVSILLQGDTEKQSPPQLTTEPYVSYNLERQTTLPTKVIMRQTAAALDTIPVGVAIQLNIDGPVPRSPSGQLVWPFHVILIKLDERPRIIPATVPILEIGRQTFNALFEVDIRSAANASLSGKYQVYIDVGREFLGPYQLSVSQ
jgi:hypothetical protein